MENRFILKSLFILFLIAIIFIFFVSQEKSEKDFLFEMNLSNKKIQTFYDSIKEVKYFSQNKEDGVILSLLDLLRIPKTHGTFVEFGTESGKECNTRYLREVLNWTGLLMDGSNENLEMNLHKEKIHYSNIIQLFEKYKVKIDLDLFSEDTDYADYWIVQEVLTKYKPKIIIVEVNQQPPERCVTVPKPNIDQFIFWDGSNYHGASVCAFYCLAKSTGYTMVYCESRGVNCFLVRNDLLYSLLKIDINLIQHFLNSAFLFKKPSFVYSNTSKVWHHISCV